MVPILGVARSGLIFFAVAMSGQGLVAVGTPGFVIPQHIHQPWGQKEGSPLLVGNTLAIVL